MKILYVTTISNTVNTFLIPHIKMLINEGHQVDVAFKVEQEVKLDLIKLGCKIHHVPFNRSPLRIDNIKAYKKIKNIIITDSYDLVHTHTPVASAIVRLACKNLKNIKVFYTAHGFHFYKGAPLINWLVYYPIEKWLAKYTDVLVTINEEDYKTAKTRLKIKRVEYLPGVGINVRQYRNLNVDKERIRRESGVPENAFLLLSVGELNKNKNHEVVIRALEEIAEGNIHYMICGEGNLENYLKELAIELDVSKNVHLLGYRKDIPAMCKISDVFVFPSKREGLGLAAIEAMAAGLPIITSNVHGIVDYSKNGLTGYRCNPKDVNGFVNSILKLYQSTTLRSEYGRNNSNISDRYDLGNILTRLNEIYRSVINE